MKLKIFPLLAAALLAAVPLLAQTNPTGTISGRVLDPEGLAVPGATVTVESPALQGSRTTTTSTNGDYIFPFLPAGDYTVTVTLNGFKTTKQTTRVSPSETVTVSPTLSVSTVSETVTVTGEAPAEFDQQARVATNIKADLVDKLPTSRRLVDTVNLAPGVQSSGPNGGLSINGAMSFESLYVVNGVVVNENIRSQPLNLFIEDALQETTISTAAISAEYGRFQGGVVQAITKSGGNEFSGSYRMTFDNNNWVALTPYPNDKRTDKMLYTQEFTLGGPFIKDRLWFFGAGRLTGNRVTNNSTTATAINYDDVRNQKRFEGKLTWALTKNHTFKGAYTKINDNEDGNSFGNIMDLASLVNNRQTPQELLSANYTGILSPKFFVEAQYSRRKFTFINSGSLFTDLVKGTLMLDQSRNNARYNSPTFCGVCDPEKRDNQDITLKATYFASTSSAGAHNVVVGFDMYDDQRFANNHQSGSDFRVFGTSAIIQGTNIFPVLDDRSFIRWTPIFVGSEGNKFRTVSGYVNDTWTLNKRWTFNAGLRYDHNAGHDSQGHPQVKDQAFSPRLSATFDPKANGEWTLNASYAQYVAAIANSIGDAGSAGGQPATIDFTYLGPPVNVGNPANPVSTEVALNTLFGWFNANGGTNRTTRGAPVIPGLNVHIGDTLSSPSTREVTLGVTKRLGAKGSMRIDGIYRKYHNFYVTRIDQTTGQVSDQFGKKFDLGLVENNDDSLHRTYKGMNVQIAYRPVPRLNLSGNYTLGELRGNVEGENGGSGPITTQIERYPEYFNPAWNYSDGDLNEDVRHKVRAWATWDAPLPSEAGALTVGVLEQFNTGSPYGANGPVDTRPFVAGSPLTYISPPANVPYFFTARDAYHMDDLWRTDLALNYSHKLGWKKSELFARFTTVNLFNRQGLTNFVGGINNDLDLGCGTGGCITTTVQTNANTGSVAPFNPFTTTPVEGVNWKLAPTFGQPTSRYAYQTPRTFQFAVGVRF